MVHPEGGAGREEEERSRILSGLRELGGFLGHSMLRFYNDNCFQTAAALLGGGGVALNRRLR